MKTCARDATGSTIRSRVDPRPLIVGGATSTALRHVQHQRPPMQAAPGSYAPHTVTCDWIALAPRLGRAAFGPRLAAVRPPAVALQLLFVASQPAGYRLPPACVARSLRGARSVARPAFAPALAHIGRPGCAD